VAGKPKLEGNLKFQNENNCQFIFSLGMLWLIEKFYRFKMIGDYSEI